MKIFTQNVDKIKSIPAIQIEPNRVQPRINFSKEELESLSNSIKENGILQPLIVRKVYASKFELVAGERRLRAAIMAGFKIVPCVILNCDEKQAAIFTLLENLQRSDLGLFEEAKGIQRLIENCGITQEIAAKKLGKKQSTIANKLRLLKLTKGEQDKITKANLSERHARALLRLTDENQRDFALKKIILNGLNVQKSESLIDSMISGNDIRPKNFYTDKQFTINDLNNFMNILHETIDTMRLAGTNVERSCKETENFMEYVIKIPKNFVVKKEDIA